MDLLPHTNFGLERITADMLRLAPSASIFPVSALEDDGIEPAFDWLMEHYGHSPVS